MNIFLGKFSKKYPEQIENKFCCAGKEGSKYYGDIKIGDYVFVSYQGQIIALWRAKEYTRMKSTVHPDEDRVLSFDEIKKYDDVGVTNDFTRYKYFVHDLNLVNKTTKSVKSLGFIPIKTLPDCPKAEDIDFKRGAVNIYIALKTSNLDYKEGDVRVTVNNNDEMRIISIDRYVDGKFTLYESLNSLYDERNAEEGKYTIRELCDYALSDKAAQKRNFLITLIDELESSGYHKVSNAVKLYDNLLVGRKKTFTSTKTSEKTGENNPKDVEIEYDNLDEYDDLASLLNFNPNLILYGPPGTGKTYSTQKIIDSFEKKYFKKDSSYDLVEAENRVEMVTFHQSYSYEEFIEGIRPMLCDDGESKIGYKLENGLFKEMCINAEKELIKRQDTAEYVDRIHSDSSIWKISLGERNSDEVYNECIETSDIAINWLDDTDLSDTSYEEIYDLIEEESEYEGDFTQNANTINSFVNEMTIGDIVLVYDGRQTIRMIGVVNEDYRYDDKFDYKHRRKVMWFENLNYPIDIHSYNGHKNLSMKTLYKLWRVNVSDVIEMIDQHSTLKQNNDDKKEIKPYYMIIDEINRGNISKIFGELITLVEQDKRGVAKSILPYSKKDFSVPSNLYIIGTMNTADRSIAAIDTALRRRFTFVEIEPDSKILEHDNRVVNDNVDLSKLLDAVNEEIMDKYDRDHRIGHAYFMGIESLKNLYQTWYYKILPLLGEYFYNDTDMLISIVGDSFYDENGNINFLSMSKTDDGVSEFEKKLIEIYEAK